MNRHDKFKAYWESIGKPQLEAFNSSSWSSPTWTSISATPSWFDYCDYRIAGDPHWGLRRKWIESDFTLPIEYKSKIDEEEWIMCKVGPNWVFDYEYREAKQVSNQEIGRAFGHYWKSVKELDGIDVYKVLELFEVKSHAVGHAVKKLLCAGARGAKGERQDVLEAIAALQRHIEMLDGR